MKRIILVTGGERSGKSSYAEALALRLSTQPIYLATAHVWDEEFALRIRRHQAQRSSKWTTIEEERNLSAHNVEGHTVLVDCLTLWATNFLPAKGLPDVEKTLEELKAEFDRFTSQEATFIFVTNEIGMGGTSSNALQRRFTSLLGWLNQYVAQQADEVIWMVSGIPVRIKG